MRSSNITYIYIHPWYYGICTFAMQIKYIKGKYSIHAAFGLDVGDAHPLLPQIAGPMKGLFPKDPFVCP